MPQTLSPRIIQTILPCEQKPERSIVATWTKRAVTERELLELEPHLSENLVSKIPRWKEDVVAQPTRLLASVMTGNLYLLEREWREIEVVLRNSQIPIEYLNRAAFEPSIAIEESISLKSFAEVLFGSATAFVVSTTGVGHELFPRDPALADAALHLVFGLGFLTVAPGLTYIANRLPRLLPFSLGRPVPEIPQRAEGDLYDRLRRPEPQGKPPQES